MPSRGSERNSPYQVSGPSAEKQYYYVFLVNYTLLPSCDYVIEREDGGDYDLMCAEQRPRVGAGQII